MSFNFDDLYEFYRIEDDGYDEEYENDLNTDQALTRAEAVLALLNKKICTISICWEDVEFYGSI